MVWSVTSTDPYILFQGVAELRDIHALAQTCREGRRVAERLYDNYWFYRLERLYWMPEPPLARSICREALLAFDSAPQRYRVLFRYVMPLVWPLPWDLGPEEVALYEVASSLRSYGLSSPLPPKAFPLFYEYMTGVGACTNPGAHSFAVKDRHELYAILQDLFLLNTIDQEEYGHIHNDHTWFYVIGYVHAYLKHHPIKGAFTSVFLRVIRRQMKTYIDDSHEWFLENATTRERAADVLRWTAVTTKASRRRPKQSLKPPDC